MAKSATPKKPAKSFEQLAREHGADESGEKFERAFEKIVPPKTADSDDGAPKGKAKTKQGGR